ncbi:Hypothetical predicted protein, partial [Pelobates cultripes]
HQNLMKVSKKKSIPAVLRWTPSGLKSSTRLAEVPGGPMMNPCSSAIAGPTSLL